MASLSHATTLARHARMLWMRSRAAWRWRGSSGLNAPAGPRAGVVEQARLISEMAEGRRACLLAERLERERAEPVVRHHPRPVGAGPVSRHAGVAQADGREHRVAYPDRLLVQGPRALLPADALAVTPLLPGFRRGPSAALSSATALHSRRPNR